MSSQTCPIVAARRRKARGDGLRACSSQEQTVRLKSRRTGSSSAQAVGEDGTIVGEEVPDRTHLFDESADRFVGYERAGPRGAKRVGVDAPLESAKDLLLKGGEVEVTGLAPGLEP